MEKVRMKIKRNYLLIQKGYSLVELSVALAIIAVILLGALMGTRQVMLSNSVNNQVRETATVISKVQRHFSKQPNTASVNTHVLGRLGVWPPERATVRATATSVRGVLNGSSEFIFSNSSAIGTMPANSGFIYTLRNVPTEACGDLLTALDTLSFALYAGPSPGAAPADGSNPSSTVVKAPDATAIDMANQAAACAPGNANGVDVAIVFRQ